GGGAPGGSSGTLVIGGGGEPRWVNQLAALPVTAAGNGRGSGSVQVDLGVLEGPARLRLRPPAGAGGASGSVALRPPAAGGAASQLAHAPAITPSRIVLRPPMPTPRPDLR